MNPTSRPASVNLSLLLHSLQLNLAPGQPDAGVTGVVMDSRQVQPGHLFVAVSGGSSDGHLYIPDAIRRGACAVVGTQALGPLEVPYFQVPDSRRALAYLAAAYFGWPARHLVVIGVTGTDGKTTTANLIYHILQAAGLQAGMISTVNAQIGGRVLDTGFHVTTPDAPAIQNYLAQMVAAGLTHVVLEATSHGLAQQRVAACDFDLAVVTNITHEHLDYHGSYAAYRAAKGSLFAGLAATPPKAAQPPRGAVLNGDDLSYEYLAEITRVAQISYGVEKPAQVRAGQITLEGGLQFVAAGSDLDGRPFCIPLRSPLEGAFNVANCLAAVSLTRGFLDLDEAAIQHGLAKMPGGPERMGRIVMGQDFSAIVDFAHTPNALRRALEAARQMTRGRVIALFGSAGLRDRAKRRMMAETAAELADLTILTAEDLRTESLAAILAEMAEGMRARGGREGETFWRVPDRRQALRFGVEVARRGDLLLACGKGHEQSLCFGEVEYPWDERQALRAALAEHLGIPGPAMPYLPG